MYFCLTASGFRPWCGCRSLTLVPTILLGSVLIVAPGCTPTKTHKVDNPVMGPAPPRISNSEMREAAPAPSLDEAYVIDPLDPTIPGIRRGEVIEQVDAIDPQTVSPQEFSAGGQLSDQQVVATVNGSPIFASELLERYGPQLMRAKQQLPPVEFRRVRSTLIRRDLNRAIQRRLLADAMKASLDKEKLEQLDQFVDSMFQGEVDRLKKEFNVNTKLELQQILDQQGTSLARLKDDFAAQRMAMEYMGSQAPTNQRITRPELLQYYRDHWQDYAVSARTKWQQIRISFAKYGGKQAASKVLEAAVMELREGADFADVARRYSDGPKAADGGHWPWTLAGSLADEEIDKVLFQLEPGSVSQVITGERDFRIVKVVERQEAGRIPFEDVQEEIQKTIKQQEQADLTQKVIDELMETAVIETIFDKAAQ